MKRSLIVDVVVRTEFHALLVVSAYLLFAGHNSPGGGFAGGLVAGAALALRSLSSGPDAVRRTVRVAPTTLLGIGLVVSLTTAIIPLLAGHDLLEHAKLELAAPLLGEGKITSAFAFDLGVYLVVVGLVASLLLAFDGPDDDPLGIPPGPEETVA